MADPAETIRAFYEAFNGGRFDDAIEFIHPEGVLNPALEPVEALAGGRTRLQGRASVRAFFQMIEDSWEQARVEIKELIEGLDGRIISVETWRVRGAQGIELDTELTDVFAFRDGLIVQCDGFRDRRKALEEFGR